MKWLQHDTTTRSSITGVVASLENDYLAVTRDGSLVAGQWGGSGRVLARASQPLLGIAYAPENRSICAVGMEGTVLSGREGTIREEQLKSRLRLVGVCSSSSGEWILAGQFDARSGCLFQGAPGAWHEVPFARHPTGLECIVQYASDKYLVAGGRGYVGLWSGGAITTIPSGTDHPLRAASIVSNGIFLVGGGGWAANMPILLQGDKRGLVPIESASGNRVIVGIARTEDQFWICENRSDGESWRGIVSSLTNDRTDIAHEFPRLRLNGIAAHRKTLVVWGEDGFLASSQSI